MIRTIIFDLSGVLFTDGSPKFTRELCDRFKNLNYQEVLNEIIDGEGATLYRVGKIGAEEFWKRIIEKYKISEDKKSLNDWWLRCYELVDATREIILDLRQKFKVYYLSDSVCERIEDLEKRYGFTKWFDGGIYSHEVGVRKPNPEVYKIILKKYNLISVETIFIDDKEKNLVSARDLGMKTILFENAKQLKIRLNQILL